MRAELRFEGRYVEVGRVQDVGTGNRARTGNLAPLRPERVREGSVAEVYPILGKAAVAYAATMKAPGVMRVVEDTAVLMAPIPSEDPLRFEILVELDWGRGGKTAGGVRRG